MEPAGTKMAAESDLRQTLSLIIYWFYYISIISILNDTNSPWPDTEDQKSISRAALHFLETALPPPPGVDGICFPIIGLSPPPFVFILKSNLSCQEGEKLICELSLHFSILWLLNKVCAQSISASVSLFVYLNPAWARAQAGSMRLKVKRKLLCRIWLFATPWTSARNSPGQNTGVGSLSLLQGIFPTQGSNPGLPHCRQILYQLSHKGSPMQLKSVTKLRGRTVAGRGGLDPKDEENFARRGTRARVGQD